MKLNALQKRTLRLEQLENRELLSATTWNDAAQADAALAAEMVATLNENAPIDLTAAFSAAEIETTSEEATIWRVISDGDGVGEVGTLRWAVENAQPGDSIRFDASLSRDHGDGKGEYVKITLEQGEIKIDKDLTIDAYGLYRFDKLEGLIYDQDCTGVTIDAGGNSRIFNIAEWTDEELENAPDQKVELKIIGVHMTNGSLHNNVDNYVHGGAIHVPEHGALTLEMCVISNSTAIEGGGAIAVSGELRASDTIFENNNGGEDHGGAIRVFDGFVEVIDCYFRNNVIRMVSGDYSSGGGGAVSATGGVFRSFNTLYSGNCASFGGAFFVGGGEVYLSNSLVVENGAIRDDDVCSDGGGVNVDSGHLTIVNSTIAGNKITGNVLYKRGAGLFANADAGSLEVYIYNSIIAENSYLNDEGSWVVGRDVTINEPWWGSNKKVDMYGWNNLSSFDGWEGESSGNLTYDGSEPLFTEANGLKYALAEGSRAINGGKVEYAKDYYGRSIEADFIRYRRVIGDNIDIGALEYDSEPYYEAISRPENVRFSDYDLGAKTVVVSWDDKSYQELGFRVEISTDGENWSWVAQTAENVSSTTLANIEPNTTYYVRVRAEVELSKVSEWSDVADFTAVVNTLDEPVVSAIPASSTEISFSIGEVENAVGYVYEYSADPNFGEGNVTRGELPTSGMLTISGLQPFTQYYFRAYAVGSGLYLDSPWSSTLAKTEQAVLPAPTPSVALTEEETTLELAFKAVDNAVEYVYRYSTNPDFDGAVVVTTKEAGAFEIAGLEPGATYYFQAKAEVGGAYVDSDWSATISGTTEAVYLAPPSVAVEAVGTTTLSFKIGSVANATAYRYRVATSEAELANAAWIERVDAGTVELSKLSDGTNLHGGTTYYFQAYAVGDGTAYYDSAESAPVSATTLKIVLNAPSVSATPVDFSTITFNIGFVANAENGYVYEYSTSADFSNATPGKANEFGSFDVSGLKPATTYYFRAKAVGTGAYENSDWSETASATTPKIDLATPTIDAVATSSTSIDLTINPVDYATGYYCEYSADPNFGNVLTAMAGAETIAITGLEPRTTYYFRVLAYGGDVANISGWATDDATTLQAKLPAPQPTLALGGTRALTLSFDAVPNATSYVYRYSTSPDFANATTATATSAGSFTVRDLTPGQTYYFQTAAVGDGERYLDSDWSTAISATTSAIDLPAPPVAIQTVGSTTLTFKIDAVAGADAYEYCYATSEEGLKTAEVKRVSSAGTFELSGLSPVTKYYVQARAVGNETNYENSGWSTVDATTVKIALDAPQVGATAVDASTITFEIQEVANADYYEYEYSTSRYFTAETTTPGTATSAGSFDVSELSPFTTYYFRAKAVVDAESPLAETHESSAWSTEASATTAKAALSSPQISAVALDTTTLALTIDPVANAAGYAYLMSTDPSFDGAEPVASGSGTIALTGLTPGATYYFKAMAKADANGAYAGSDWSAPTSATMQFTLATPTISAVATSHTTLDFSIAPVENATAYVYRYAASEEGLANAESVVVSVDEVASGAISLSGLNPFTTYYFEAYAVGDGAGYLNSDVAAAEKRTWENPSMIVTTESDVVDPTDGWISLREAACVYSVESKYDNAVDVVRFADDVVNVRLTAGEIEVVRALAFEGGDDVTVAVQDDSSRVFNVVAGSKDAPVVFDGLTIAGGYASHGAGVYVSGAATFENVTMTANEATVDGGGVYVATGGYASLTDVVVTGNNSKFGAGVYVYGTADLSNVQITNNTASDRAGGLNVSRGGTATAVDVTITGNGAGTIAGGVWVERNAVATLTGGEISGNTARSAGGGLYVEKDGVAYVTEVSVTANEAKDGAGAYLKGSATLTGGEIAKNIALGSGGGLCVNATGRVYATADVEGKFVVVSGNKAKSGAGLYVGGEADLSNFEIVDNTATASGGGVYLAGSATFTRETLITGNTAENGGGLYVVGGTTDAPLKFDALTLTGNQASNGGGVYLNGVAEFTDSTLSGSAAAGGGVYVGTNGVAAFVGSALSGSAETGGGAYLRGVTTFEGSTLSGSATGGGGAAYVHSKGKTTISGGAISGASAKWGGGLYVAGTANLSNVALTDNTATRCAGGVYLDGSATFTQTTVAGNTAENGAGFYIVGTSSANFRNSIVVDSVVKAGTATVNAYNTLSSFVAWTNKGATDVANYVYDATLPLFADGVYALAENSQAIDKGDNQYAVDDAGAALATDLAGNARVVGSAVDLGAYESQSEVVSAAFEALEDFDFFVDEDDLDALASRLV